MGLIIFSAWCLFSYGLGCVSWASFLVRRLRGLDLREHGSGNLGATNAGRILGRRWAVIIYLLDFGKGAVAAGAPTLIWQDLTASFPLVVVAGLLSILGHVFPAHLGFRGGKGVATASGVIAVLWWPSLLLALGAWILTAATSRMVSAASIVAAISIPISYYLTLDKEAVDPWKTGLFLLLAIMVTFLHRGNIGRILNGTESRIGPQKK